jgi:DNA-binding PadR family transcriptional regulator
MGAEIEVQSSLPLTEVTFFILLSLAQGPRHGYAIMQEVSDLTNGRITLMTGTLYGALRRLLEQGWIDRVVDGGSEETGRTRKEYRLSEIGREILNAEITRLEEVVRIAHYETQGQQV